MFGFFDRFSVFQEKIEILAMKCYESGDEDVLLREWWLCLPTHPTPLSEKQAVHVNITEYLLDLLTNKKYIFFHN